MEIMASVQSEVRASRAKIIDVREQRLMAQGLEIREDGTADQFVLEGYAATFEPYDCYGGVERGGWIEQIDPKAFDKTLRNSPDVQLLINHEGLMLARTTSGTLSLSVDNKGLKVRAHLDRNDPDVQRIAPKMKRGDLNEMSFAFRVLNQRWDNNYEHRLITEVSLQRGDVSIVSYGMNPDTHAVLTEQAVGALARMSMDDLAELRSLAPEKLEAAIRVLTRAKDDSDSSGFTPPAGVRAEAKRALEWIKEGHAGGGFTDVGRKRAADLAAGRSVGRDTIGRIANYLARHEGDKKGEGWSPGDSGYPSPGRVAWAAWGGDPAKSWTKSIIAAEDSSRTEYSLPHVSTIGTRAADPKPNMQNTAMTDHAEEDTEPADMSGSHFQSGINDKPVVTKTGASNTPVKMEIDPVNGVTNTSRINTPIMQALVKSLESTINNAYMVAQSNNDSSRALVAEAAEQITKIREDLSNLPKPETDIERKLKQLSSATDEKNPFAAGASDEVDDEEDVKDDMAEEDTTDKVEPAKRSAEDVMNETDEDETEEDETDDDDDEEETPPGMGAGFSVARALKELQEGAGVPVIESVSDGLEYFNSLKR